MKLYLTLLNGTVLGVLAIELLLSHNLEAQPGPGLPYFTTGSSSITCNDGGVTANWAVRVVANGGANPSTATTNAILTFVCGCMTDGTWSKINSINIFAPDSLIACITPLKVGTGVDPWVNHNFVLADLSINGLTGNASNKQLDSGVDPTAFGSSTTLGFSWYAYNVIAGGVDLGVYNEINGIDGTANFSSTSRGLNGTVANNNLITGSSSGNGYYTDLRVSSTDHRLFFANGSTTFAQIGSTDTTSWTGPFAAGGATIFCLHDSNGSLQVFTSDTLSCVAFFSGFNQTDAKNLFTRDQTLRTSFGGGFR